MKIAVINGSPKGAYSITLQTINYLSAIYKEHEFEVLHAAQTIHALEKDFSKAKSLMENADAVFFVYPVYTFIVPAQLHRFIELMEANGVNIKDKYVSQFSTSKHFYDVTAHKYIQQICEDFGAKYVRGLSADMDDLTKPQGQNDAKAFFEYFIWNYKNGISEKKTGGSYAFESCKTLIPETDSKKNGGETVIVTDATEKDVSLNNMIEAFRRFYPKHTKIVNLNDVNNKGGCLGCLNCASSGKCVYIDGFDDFLRSEIQTAEATVYAFTIKNHCMGSLFKKYDDRQFCNGHRTVTAGKPVGYIVSGNLSQEENLRMIIDARAEAGGNFLSYVATDEENPTAELEILAKKLTYITDNNYTQPANFYGVGGIRIFRDLIYMMRGLMKADHKFYKEHGLYDFPHKKKGTTAAMYLVGAVFGNEKIMANGGKYIKEGMLMPYKKVLDELAENKKPKN